VNVTNVRREMAQAGASVAALRDRCYGWTVRRVSPPALIVELPDRATLHVAGNMTTMTVPVTLLVGNVDAEASEQELTQYLVETGPTSLIAALEDYPYTACDTVTVTDWEIVVMTMSAGPYLGALLTTDVAGRGD
jgi:hypothetical protein